MTSPRLSPASDQPHVGDFHIQDFGSLANEMPGGLRGHDEFNDRNGMAVLYGKRGTSDGFPIDMHAREAVQPDFLNGKRFFSRFIGHLRPRSVCNIVARLQPQVPTEFNFRLPQCSGNKAFSFVGRFATPDETAAAARNPPSMSAAADNLSVSAVIEPAAMLDAEATAGLILSDPSVPAGVLVSAPNIAETAAIVRVGEPPRQITVAADIIPDLPAFLQRGADGIAPFMRLR